MEISASQWRQIVDSAVDTAIISTDREGRVTSWNSGAVRILGYQESEMLGKSLDVLFTPQDRQRGVVAREITDATSLGRGGGEEGWRVRKNGELFWGMGELSPIRDRGEIIGFVKVLRDRTVQRQAEEELREERRALEILNRAGSALSAENELAKVVQIVTDAGVELSGAEFGAFFYNVLNEAGESYTLYTLSGAPIEAFSKFPMPRNTEVFGPTFRGEAIVRADDITKDPRYGKNAPRKGMPEGHLPVRSYLAVPVISRTADVVGGLFFGHAKVGVFKARSESVLAGLAGEAAIAIDNARLTQSMQREIAERKKAQEELAQLNANLEAAVAERTEQLRKSEGEGCFVERRPSADRTGPRGARGHEAPTHRDYYWVRGTAGQRPHHRAPGGLKRRAWAKQACPVSDRARQPWRTSMDTTRKTDTTFDINALLHPAAAYEHPMDVLRDTDLSLNEKRAILASWASDACAVEAAPELRRHGSGRPVSFDEIMEALKILDGEAHARTDYGKLVNRVRRVRDLYGRGDGGTGGIFVS